MDDESEADLYGDLLPFDQKNYEDFKKVEVVEATNANLRHENELLKQKIERLLLENRALTQDKKKLETNFSSLIKTAQTEMKRKDQTIAELRREKDSVVFRRGRNPRYDNRSQDRNHPEPRHEVQRAEYFEQSYEPVIAPKPLSQSVIAPPVIEAVTPIAVPSVPAEEVNVLKVQDAEIILDVPKLVPKSNACLQTVFSKRHSSAIYKSITKTTVPTENAAESLCRVEDKRSKTSVSSDVSTPEMNPEARKKKRITPVMISEPTPKVIDQNKNKIKPPTLGRDESTPKIASESHTKVTTVCEVTTPKAAKLQTNHEVPAIDPIKISKSKIVTHVKASYDTSNSKTKDFKRRVSTSVKDTKLNPESLSKSPLKCNPSFVSENSSDGLRRPSNYDLMKRNIKHKYHALESPKKSDRSRRSRSRSVWAREKRDRSKSSHRTRSERKPESRRKDCASREDKSFKRHSHSRRQSKADHSPTSGAASKRDSSPGRRGDDFLKRKVPTYSELRNFSPVLSSTAKKDSDKKSSSDRLLLDSQEASTSKSRVRLDDVLDKSVGSLSSADKLNQKEVKTAIETSRRNLTEPTTASTKPTETVRKVSSSACNAPTKCTDLKSTSKQADAKRKSIEAVADSLTIKLTSTQTTETTTKTVEAFTFEAALTKTNKEPVEEPKTQPINVESSTKTKITEVISMLTNNIMPIPPKDFLTSRILADYKTPTASAENSREVLQTKTMSPPDVPKPKSGHGPTSFSGIKLGGDPKHFSYPFTPMKIDIANEYMSFPSMITPLKATPVKADFMEEDSLDLMMRLQLARNKDQLGNAERVECTVTRAEKEVGWKLHTLESSDSAGTMDNEKAKDLEGKASETVDKVPDKSVSVSNGIIEETQKEAGKKGTSDAEDGEITDDSSPASPKEPEKPIVMFFKKSTETMAKRTRLIDVKRVVSPTKMLDLRQRLLARTECVAPARKDIRDYEIRLKSPFKTSPRISSSSGANLSSRPEGSKRLTYNDYPPSSSRSRSPKNHGRLSRSKSPTTMFLEKSPERLERRKSGSRSPRQSDTAMREKAYHRTRPKRHTASSSGSQSPHGVRGEKPDSQLTRSHQKSSARLSTSASLSRSTSPIPRSAKRPQRLQSISQSRSKSPLISNVRKSVAKPVDRTDRFHASARTGGSHSRSKSPSRETRNGPSKINDRLQRLAGERSGGGFSFGRRRSRYVADDGRQDWSAGRSKQRSRSKSRSRSSSPIKAVSQRSEGRHSRSQESCKKMGRSRDQSESPSPERVTKAVTQRSKGWHSRSQESPKKAERGRDRSDSPCSDRTVKALLHRSEGRHSQSQESPKKMGRGRDQSESPSLERISMAVTQGREERHSQAQESPKKTGRVRDLSDSPSTERLTKAVTQGSQGRHCQSQEISKETERTRDQSGSTSPDRQGSRVGNDNSARPFRRRRTVFKTDPNVWPGNPRPEKVSEQMKLIERILDSDSGISEKNISPVAKTRAGATTPDQAKDEAHMCSYVTPISNNLPDILSTLDSNQSPIKSPPVQTVPDKPKSLDDFVNNLIQTTNPDMQKCLESVRANFNPSPVVAENKPTQPKTPATNNGFVVRKRRTTRMLPQETPWPANERSPVKLSVSVPEIVQPSELTPDKPCDPAIKSPNVTGSVPSGNKSAAGSQAFSSPSIVAAVPEKVINSLPFGRRRRTVRMLPQSENTTPNPTPSKETGSLSVAQSPSLDLGRKSNDVTSTEPSSECPILKGALEQLSSKDVNNERVEGTTSAQQSPQSDCEQNLHSKTSKRAEKRKRDDSEEKPWKKHNRGIVSRKVVKASYELERKAKSLFGSDTEDEEDGDFTVKHSEYAKMGGESSDDDPYVSDGEESNDSDDEWKPARCHSRKVSVTPSPKSSPEVQRIWPAKPEERKRRTTVFLEDLPKSSEKIIAELMNRANRSLSAKKKKRHSIKPMATSKAPKSAEFVPTDDSD